MRSARERLEDVLSAINLIQRETLKGREHFDQYDKTQVWVLHYLRVIGEAIRPNSDILTQIDPETPWAQIVGMRHIIVHDYMGVDLDMVWSAAQKDLEPLRASIERLLASSALDSNDA